MSARIAIRLGVVPVSVRVRTRVVVVVVAAIAALVGAALYVMTLGDFPLSISQVYAALFTQTDEFTRFIVVSLRLSRVVAAALAGAALGTAGAIFQGVARNPLVAPDIIGVNNGAALVAVTLIVIVGAPFSVVWIGALAGGLVAGAVVYTLSLKRGLSRYRMVLVGVGVNAICVAGIGYVLTRGEIDVVQQAVTWQIGSLFGVGWESLPPLAVAIAVLLPVAFGMSGRLAMLQLGDEAALALGIRVERDRLILLATAVGLAAAAVAVAGPIGFVAFVSPHIARILCRGSGPGIVPASAAIGTVMVLVADALGQRLFAPIQLPVGVFTSIIGAPYFLLLLYRSNRTGRTA